MHGMHTTPQYVAFLMTALLVGCTDIKSSSSIRGVSSEERTRLYTTVTHDRKSKSSIIETFYIQNGRRIKHGPGVRIDGEFEMHVDVFDKATLVETHYYDGRRS
jgi:hypothetical protein